MNSPKTTHPNSENRGSDKGSICGKGRQSNGAGGCEVTATTVWVLYGRDLSRPRYSVRFVVAYVGYRVAVRHHVAGRDKSRPYHSEHFVV